jgi:hypothetical protein
MVRNAFRFKRLPDRVTFLKIELERQFNKFKIHFPLMSLKIITKKFIRKSTKSSQKKKIFEIFLNYERKAHQQNNFFFFKRYSIFLCSSLLKKFLPFFFLGSFGICVCVSFFLNSPAALSYISCHHST